jgi:ubiquinone/menaquinone biosynthesis C-methylase UbiE
MKLNDIKEHWEQAGRDLNLFDDVSPTSRDPYLGLLERENILEFLKKDQTCLELGCGDALHTVHYAQKIKKIQAVDVAQSLIDYAKQRTVSLRIDNIEFTVGSILDLNEIALKATFDCVVSQRCLINLPKWEQQKAVIFQVSGILRDKGIFLVTEGFQGELDNLNHIRKKVGLSEIQVVPYNKNMIRNDFEMFVKQYFDILEIRHYGTYLFLSRVFHPLMVSPEQPKHVSKFNEMAMQICKHMRSPEFENFSYNLLYVLRKK